MNKETLINIELELHSFNYEIKETVEAGIELTGDEVKSLRQRNVSLADDFATVHSGELFLLNCYIAPYSHAYSKEDGSKRSRRLLLPYLRTSVWQSSSAISRGSIMRRSPR